MKTILTFLLLITCVSAFSQKVDTYHDTLYYEPDTALIGYISVSGDANADQTINQEFEEVVLFIYSKGVDVIDICKEDGLILMLLSEEWKDVYQLIDEINKNYTGVCYVKNNRMSFYKGSCAEKIKKIK